MQREHSRPQSRWTLQRASEILLSALREIFDESAYARFSRHSNARLHLRPTLLSGRNRKPPKPDVRSVVQRSNHVEKSGRLTPISDARHRKSQCHLHPPLCRVRFVGKRLQKVKEFRRSSFEEPLAVSPARAPFRRPPFAPRMIEQTRRLRLKNVVGSGMIRLVRKFSATQRRRIQVRERHSSPQSPDPRRP